MAQSIRAALLLVGLFAAASGCDTTGPGTDDGFTAPPSVMASAIAGSSLNATDSYVRGTLVVDFDATVISDSPM